MTRKTPDLPSRGGSYTRDSKGKLTRTAGTAPAPKRGEQTPPAPAKSSEEKEG